jgi:uncharacterized integral membrane protein
MVALSPFVVYKEVLVFFLILVVFLLVAGILGLITWQNLSTFTHLNLYFWKTPQIPVGLLLIGAIVFGALLIYLVAFLSARREQRELRRLRLRVVELEERQKQVFTAPALLPSSFFAQQLTAPMLPDAMLVNYPSAKDRWASSEA